jgi:hypothetical protein
LRGSSEKILLALFLLGKLFDGIKDHLQAPDGTLMFKTETGNPKEGVWEAGSLWISQ